MSEISKKGYSHFVKNYGLAGNVCRTEVKKSIECSKANEKNITQGVYFYDTNYFLKFYIGWDRVEFFIDIFQQ